MVTPPKGPLRRPAVAGFMGPLSILMVAEAAEKICGAPTMEDLLKAAQIYRLPGHDEPVRETRVADLHCALRRELPEKSELIARLAGRMTADFVMEHRMSHRAQIMLQNMPWHISAWMLGRTTELNSWTFAGSGEFKITGRLDFQITGNPVIKGETSDVPICHYHAAQLERLFQKLIDGNLVCVETACAAAGADHCHFVIRSDRRGVLQ